MSTTVTRSEALELLHAADHRRAEATVPTLSPREREDLLLNCWEHDPTPTANAADDPADVALSIIRGEHGCFRLVRPELDDPGNPRYDKVLVQLLPQSYYGVTNEYLSDMLASIGHPGITVTGDREPLLPCPCCGYRTLARRGEYDICPVCFWEDTGSDDPERFSGPNHMTLAEGRRNSQATGATAERSHPYIDPPNKYVRAIDYSQE
jgi:hypothetical protein